MTPDEIINEMKVEFSGGGRGRARTYVGGLLPAFCQFFSEIGTPGKGYHSFADFLQDYPLITEGVSTLTVQVKGGQKTIRPAYNSIHSFYIFEKKRLGYPRSEPYATGKWGDYRRWLDSLVSFSADELKEIRDRTIEFVLAELEPVVFDPASVRIEPPIFKQLLEEFNFRARGRSEPTGAAFQAVVFGFIRADAPHLQVEARKVRTGSARLQGIGDIDAWEGDRLVISAEVKHFVFKEDNVSSLEHFSHEVQQRAALGLVVAENFAPGVREQISALGLRPLSQTDVLTIVSLWDPVKQRAALNAFQWVVAHKEQSPGLIARVNAFLVEIGYEPKSRSAPRA